MAPRRTKPHHTDVNSHPDTEIDSEANLDPQALPSSAPPARTNSELNLSVLKRHNPSITAILSIAPYAVIYTFSPTIESWEKSNIEGTLFVCQLAGNEDTGQERYETVVLNRRGLDNFELELQRPEDVDVEGEYVILQGKRRRNVAQVNAIQHGENMGIEQPDEDVIYGLWIFAEKAPSSTSEMRTVNARLIKDCAIRAQESRRGADEARLVTQQYSQQENSRQVFGAAGQGRQLSLLELFSEPRLQDSTGFSKVGYSGANEAHETHGGQHNQYSGPQSPYDGAAQPNVLDGLFQRARYDLRPTA